MTAYLADPRSGRAAGAPAGQDPPTLRLLCFHHAGGTATGFAGWTAALGPGVQVLPVQLPGRERRAAEPRFTDITELAADLDRELGPWLTGPHAFYGHSMGATVAYALTRHRLGRGLPPPRALLVGASGPPHAAPRVAALLDLDDEQLTQWLVRLGAMSPALLPYPEWVRAALSLLRDDIRLTCSLRAAADDPLPVPVEVFTGDRDPLLDTAAAAGWERHAGAGFRLHVVPGGHFFPNDEPDAFFAELAAALRRL